MKFTSYFPSSVLNTNNYLQQPHLSLIAVILPDFDVSLWSLKIKGDWFCPNCHIDTLLFGKEEKEQRKSATDLIALHE